MDVLRACKISERGGIWKNAGFQRAVYLQQ